MNENSFSLQWGVYAQVTATIKVEEGVVIHVRKCIDFKEIICMLVVK